MACFAVPTAEAVIVTAVAYAIRAKQNNAALTAPKSGFAAKDTKIDFSTKLMWLARMLWGGSFLLAFEHVWHGEVVPWFPFLTAAGNPADAVVMLHEMATVGVTMAVLVTLIWGGMVLVADALTKRTPKVELEA